MSSYPDYARIECEEFDGVQMPPCFEKIREKIAEFNVREDDIWVTSYSKCGTTWTQELVWLLVNNFNYEGAKEYLELRFPFIEYKAIAEGCGKFIKDNNITSEFCDDATFPDPIKLIEDSNSKRLIKSHLPWDFLPKQIINRSKTPKIIHVIRSPKQVVSSYYHHSVNLFPMFKGTLDQFVDDYINGKVLYGDYFRTALTYWNQRHLANLLIVRYEEMIADLPKAIRKIAGFLEIPCSEDEVQKLAHHLNFDQMKNNRAVNKADFVKNESAPFMRKGTSNSYRREFTPEMIQKLDKWINESIKGTDFPYRNM